MQLALKYATFLAIAGSAFAIPANGGTTTSSVGATTASPTAGTPITSTGVTVSPTPRPAVPICGGFYPTGSSYVGSDGTTTSVAPTVYATWAQQATTYVGSDGTTSAHIVPTATNGEATSRAARDVSGATSVSAPPATVTVTPSSALGTLTTIWPDATNGGVYVNVTKTLTRSGGGQTTVTSTGWAWPTECIGYPAVPTPEATTVTAGATPSTSTPAGAPAVAETDTTPAEGEGETLNQKSGLDNAAHILRAISSPALVLGTVVGAITLAF